MVFSILKYLMPLEYLCFLVLLKSYTSRTLRFLKRFVASMTVKMSLAILIRLSNTRTCLPVCLSACQSIRSYDCHSICQFTCLSICLSVHPCVRLCARLSLSVRLYTCMYVCMTVVLSVGIPVCLCLSVHCNIVSHGYKSDKISVDVL